MSYDVCAVCRPELVPGFALTDIPVIDRIDQVEPYLETHRVGVLLVEEDLHPLLPEALRARLSASAVPMTVLFPAPSLAGEQAGEAYVVELLRRAIGYRVRLK
jgi:vacuolar-type H+-ATPase subunit F/Vma7